jgi:small subunit ribosomal protein S17
MAKKIIKTTKEATPAVRTPRQLTGVVVSDKMKDTIVVKVGGYKKHEKYKKFIASSKKFKAHDAGNTYKMGEIVTIMECRPISKDKSFTVIPKSK